jgi:hypothetical protein
MLADSNMDLREIGCKDMQWMDEAYDFCQWWTLVLALFNLCSCYHNVGVFHKVYDCAALYKYNTLKSKAYGDKIVQ